MHACRWCVASLALREEGTGVVTPEACEKGANLEVFDDTSQQRAQGRQSRGDEVNAWLNHGPGQSFDAEVSGICEEIGLEEGN